MLYQVSGNKRGTSFSHDTIAKEEIWKTLFFEKIKQNHMKLLFNWQSIHSNSHTFATTKNNTLKVLIWEERSSDDEEKATLLELWKLPS